VILTVRDDVTRYRYRIECSDSFEIRKDERGNDYLIVRDPDDPSISYWLFDQILLNAAQDGDFGLKLLTVQPLDHRENGVSR